jgi:hypothetical protein
MSLFSAHWEAANTALGASPYIVRLADGNTTLTRAQFEGLISGLQSQQDEVQVCLTAHGVARGAITLRKAELLELFGLFVSVLDGYIQNTECYGMRPVAPNLNDGQEVFSRPLGRMMTLWEEINGGPAPAGVTLPLVLSDGMSQSGFASLLSGLQFAYREEGKRETLTGLSRSKRNVLQRQAYEAMKFYREGARNAFRAFPELLEALPRLTALPGHTPAPVSASAVYEAPGSTRVVYEASPEPGLAGYQLRGTVGDHYDEEDAVVIATNGPLEEREFVTSFGLTQPGAEIALKVFVVLDTGNEAGSAPMLVERPVTIPMAA